MKKAQCPRDQGAHAGHRCTGKAVPKPSACRPTCWIRTRGGHRASADSLVCSNCAASPRLVRARRPYQVDWTIRLPPSLGAGQAWSVARARGVACPHQSMARRRRVDASGGPGEGRRAGLPAASPQDRRRRIVLSRRGASAEGTSRAYGTASTCETSRTSETPTRSSAGFSRQGRRSGRCQLRACLRS